MMQVQYSVAARCRQVSKFPGHLRDFRAFCKCSISTLTMPFLAASIEIKKRAFASGFSCWPADGPGSYIESSKGNVQIRSTFIANSFEGGWTMFEQIFDEYRNAVDSSFKMQQEMYRQWMNGWPVKPPDFTKAVDREADENMVRTYQKKWNGTIAEILEKHREALNLQYKSGIETIASAFCATEAKTPEQYWRLTQEFMRKSIDSYKTAFESHASMWRGSPRCGWRW